MITARFRRDRNQHLVSVQLTGHAGSGAYGYDIVCAATSTLALNTVNSLENLTSSQFDYAVDMENGGYLTIRLQDDKDEKSFLLMESFLLGMINLAENEPSFVSCYIIEE